MRPHPYLRAYMARLHLSLGVFGALLVLLLIPGGLALAGALEPFSTQWRFALPMIPVGMTVYYLAWKYAVSFLNAEVGIG